MRGLFARGAVAAAAAAAAMAAMAAPAGLVVVLSAAGCACGGAGRHTDAGAGGDAAPSDAAPGSDAAGAGDGGASTDAAACGDPAVAARYDQCLQAADQTSCEAAGGSWETVGLAPGPECQCPTGQGGCSCARGGDCLSSCIAPTGPGGNFDCAGVAQGTCSPASITVGCWCFFDDTGTPTGLCVD
ncbi:MAG TPA: hypothetical protein VG389_12410 [Myxococcota bacterium]|jgi:hypothetical protein|nr:hypothetical protein [Myxococcota bacterium]